MTIQIQRRETLHRGRVFDITIENVTFPNGYNTDLEIIRHPGASAIVAVDSDRQLLMLQQYRHAAGRTMWEIPAGTLENQESPKSCAIRELSEETGYAAGQWDSLGTITPVPGYADERIHIFLARHLTSTQQQLDPDEIVQVRKIGLADAVAMIAAGQIDDAKTIAGLFLALPRLGITLNGL